MKTCLILPVLFFSYLLSFSQRPELRKASPFTAVKWEEEQPVVRFENAWYYLERLAVFPQDDLVGFCQKQYGDKWKKRFSEDLVEVLGLLGYQAEKKVSLQLRKDGIAETYTGIFTRENRDSVLLYNRENERSSPVRTTPGRLTGAQAIADLVQFEEILNTVSSYARLSGYDYHAGIKKITDSVRNMDAPVDPDRLTNAMARIMSEIGDRHSSVKNESFDKRANRRYNLRLPFAIGVLHGRLIALKRGSKAEGYHYYHASYPYIKSIDGLAAEELINSYHFKDSKAPAGARVVRAGGAIEQFGRLLFENNMECPDSVAIVFSDDRKDKKEVVQLTTMNNGYVSKLMQDHYLTGEKVRKGSLDGLRRVLEGNLGYISIPEMYHYDEAAGLEDFIIETFRRFSDTRALIIDVRNNPGGGREILQTFAGYLVQEAESPWVANIAYLRTDKEITGDEPSMTGRYLYSYTSRKFSDRDREAIDQFNRNFRTEKPFDTSRFSKPFYMILRSGKASYSRPVYILANEQSFSAASVFVSAFRGLANVRIAGETTDGSSGNSKKYYLDNSGIRISVSTMLSFQRNGKTLDQNGTIPDIVIPADENQVLGGHDSQLNQLVEWINDHR